MTRALLDDRVGVGGIARYAKTLIDGFERTAPELEVVRFERSGTVVGGALTAPFSPWGRGLVARRADAFDADVIHGLHLEIPRTPRATVVTIHDIIPLRVPGSMPSAFKRKAFERIMRSSFESADRIIAPSDLTARHLIEHGALDSKVVVVPNGLEPLWFEPRSRQATRADRARVVIAVGDKAHKNPAVVAPVAGFLLPAIETVALGPWSGEAGAAHVLPWIGERELIDLLDGTDALILPSLLEGFGYPALEAAARGVPVICGRDIGARPYLGAGAVEVDVSDPREIADEVRSLLADRERHTSMSKAGAEAARALTAGSMARATYDVYRAALEEA